MSVPKNPHPPQEKEQEVVLYRRNAATLRNMIDRCYNPNNASYGDYGARGIRVCARWLENPANFDADMKCRPGPEYSIDRIDNDGDYTPENCRWATPKQQANNRRPRTRKKTSPPKAGKGGQWEQAGPREVKPYYPTEVFVRSGQHAADTESYAARVVELHPDADLSPLSIRADQERLEATCREHEARQAELRAQIGL